MFNHSALQDHILDAVIHQPPVSLSDSLLVSEYLVPVTHDPGLHESQFAQRHEEYYPDKHDSSVTFVSRFLHCSADKAAQELLSYLSSGPAGQPGLKSIKEASALSSEDLREHKIQVPLDMMSLNQHDPQLSEMMVNKTGNTRPCIIGSQYASDKSLWKVFPSKML
jgi:hypothetical protein